MTTRYEARCTACEPSTPGKTKVGDVCSACIGRGWRWSDGVPPTLCPDTLGAPPPPGVRTPRNRLPCGRRDDTCPGCGRESSTIGGLADVQRTIALDRQHDAEDKAKAEADRLRRSTT